MAWQRIDADVDPRNASLAEASRRVLGFRETGRKERTWLVGNEWCDSVYLALDASSWRLRRIEKGPAVSRRPFRYWQLRTKLTRGCP